MNKLLSGRWILTVACAGVFVYCSLTGIMKVEAIAPILMFVFQSYFNKQKEIA